MDEENKTFLPLEFTKIIEVEKVNTVDIRITMKINFYQSHRTRPERFYKPISKIFRIEKG